MNGRAMTVLYLDFLSCNMFTLDFNVMERRLSFSLKIEALISFRKDLLSGEDRYAGSWFFFFF